MGSIEQPSNGADATAPKTDGTSTTTSPLPRAVPGWLRQHLGLLVVVDVAAGVAAVLLSQVMAFGLQHAELEVRGVLIPYAAAVVGVVPAWLILLATSGAYDIAPFGSPSHEVRRIVNAGTQLLALMAVAYYIVHLEQLGRGFMIAIAPLATGLTLTGHLAARFRLHLQRRHGRAIRRAIVMGPRDTSSQLLEHLAGHPEAGIDAVAALLPDETGTLRANGSEVPIAGGPDDALALLTTTDADLLLITGNMANGGLRRLTWALEGTGIDVLVAPTVTEFASLLDVRPVAGLPLLYVDRASIPSAMTRS